MACPEGSSIRAIDVDGNVQCETDDDTNNSYITEINVADGLVGGGNTPSVHLGINTSVIQSRVTDACSEGEAIQAIAADGSVTCESMPVYNLNTTALRMQHTLKSTCPPGSSIQSISPVGDVVCHADVYTANPVTGVMPGLGLTGGGSSGSVNIGWNTSVVQARVVSTCSVGSSIRGINADGSVVCQSDADSGGDITSITGSSGILGGGSSGDVLLSLNTSYIQRRVEARCTAGSSVREIHANGSVECEADDDSGGDITAVNAGNGLAGGGVHGDVTLAIDTTVTQARIASSCGSGSSIRVINVDGSVTCEADDDSGGDITSVAVGDGLVGGSVYGDVTVSANMSVLQRRVSDGCTTGSSIRSIGEDGTVVCHVDADSGGDITGVDAGDGLVGGGTAGSISLAINSSTFQRRVVMACPEGSSIRAIDVDGNVQCEVDHSETISGLQSELASMKESLAAIQSLLVPLVHRATKQVESAAPVAASPLFVYEGTFPSLMISGAAEGDFVSLIPGMSTGCVGANSSYMVVDSAGKVKVTSVLVAGIYKICHALKLAGGDAVSNFWEQSASIDVRKSIFNDFVAINSISRTFRENTVVTFNASGNASNGGFIGFVAVDVNGCFGAQLTPSVINNDVLQHTFGTSGIFKACYAPATSGGGVVSDYFEIEGLFTVQPKISYTILNADGSYIAENASVILHLNSTQLETSTVTFHSDSAIGCFGYEDSATEVSVINGSLITPQLRVGFYKICYGGIETSLTLTVRTANVSSLVAKSSRTSADGSKFELARGASLYGTISGDITINGSVAVLSSSTNNCEGASSNAVLISHDGTVSIPITKLPHDTGAAKLCYASARIQGPPSDEAFVDQGYSFTVIDPEISVVTSELTASSVVLTITGHPDGSKLSFLTSTNLGCTGASAAASSLPWNFDATSTVLTSWTYAGTYKICYASPLSDGSSDLHYMDQGYIFSNEEPQITVDEDFSTGSIAMPAGIARNQQNGNLFVTSMTNNKIYKISSSGTQTEFKASLNGPWGIDVDSLTGDVYVAEVNGGRVTKISSSGHSVIYASGIVNVAGLTRDVATGDIFVTTYSEMGLIKKIDPHGQVTDVVGTTFNRPRGISLRQGTNELFFVVGDPAVSEGASSIKMINLATGVVVEYAAGFNSLYDIHVPSSGPYIYATDIGKQFIMKINQHGIVYKFANHRKTYTTPSNTQASMESMAPYSLTRDDDAGVIYVTNHWSGFGSDSSSNYYNQVEDNVVKVTDNRFSTGYQRRRLTERKIPQQEKYIRIKF